MQPCCLIELPSHSDTRGLLTIMEGGLQIPFPVARAFWITSVPEKQVRGEHAHKECHQFLICLHGSLKAATDNGSDRQEWHLDRPTVGLHLPPLNWGTQYDFSPGAVLLVLASHCYDEADYIRDYQDYLHFLRNHESR